MKLRKLLSVVLIVATMCSLFGGFTALAAKDDLAKGNLLINGDFELLGTSFTGWAGHGNLSLDPVHGGEKALQ
ncbi:MAG: hypothetical protein IKB92_00735 [Clostridia bacterium]|nr:hypothetical protein [Clostridia bacterium]